MPARECDKKRYHMMIRVSPAVKHRLPILAKSMKTSASQIVRAGLEAGLRLTVAELEAMMENYKRNGTSWSSLNLRRAWLEATKVLRLVEHNNRTIRKSKHYPYKKTQRTAMWH